MMKVIIVGAKGFLGRHFLRYYQQHSIDVIFTHHQKERGYDFLDLSSPQVNSSWKGYDFVLITAGITNIGYCEKEKERSYQCNVQGTLDLAEKVSSLGMTPVVFSSDYVFDGKKGKYKEEDHKNPLNEYGKQKKALEEELPKRCKKYLLLRLSKVFSIQKDRSLLDEMAVCFASNKKIKAAKDQIFSPILVDDVIYIVHQLQEKKQTGIFNVCGEETWSRLSLAKALAKKMHIDPQRVIGKISLEDLKESFQRPKNTSMKVDKIKKTLSFSFTSIAFSIEKIAENYEKGML